MGESDKCCKAFTTGTISSICVYKLTNLAGFTGAAPGRSQCGAALRLQRGSVDVDLAAAVLHRQPARTLHAVCGAEATTVNASL